MDTTMSYEIWTHLKSIEARLDALEQGSSTEATDGTTDETEEEEEV